MSRRAPLFSLVLLAAAVVAVMAATAPAPTRQVTVVRLDPPPAPDGEHLPRKTWACTDGADWDRSIRMPVDDSAMFYLSGACTVLGPQQVFAGITDHTAGRTQVRLHGSMREWWVATAAVRK